MPIILETRPLPQVQHQATRRLPSLAAVGVVIAVLAAAALQTRSPEQPGLWRRFSRAELRTHVNQFVSGLPKLQGDMKLIVGVLQLNKTLTGESAKSFLGIDLGTTKVSVTAPARAHYAIDLSKPDAVEFRVDRVHRALVAIFPEPEVQAVEVLTEAKETRIEPGWGRLKAFSGRAVEDALDRRLYSSIREEADSPAAVAELKARARPQLEKLLNRYLKQAGLWSEEKGFREMKVRFRGDDEDEAST